MEGRELLSETLAQYSAQMVMKKLRGEDYMRRYLQYELARYLEGRGYSAGEEPTLTRVNGQDHVTYRKGAMAMYLLQERLGEDRVNGRCGRCWSATGSGVRRSPARWTWSRHCARRRGRRKNRR